MKIKTRFAPSPTGYLHIGGIRTALYSWLFANQNNGKFVLRIEDSDVKRLYKPAIKSIIDSLKWLGLNWNEGPYFQTNRFNYYNKIINKMLSKKLAYKCFCTKKRLSIIREKQIKKGYKPCYDGKCFNIVNDNKNINKKYVIRFRNPKLGQIIFNDIIRGTIKFNNNELDDLIIKRSDGSPTYNFCSVIDDYYMSITHVIRGEEHINNTPRQINILKALGAPIPKYAHVSMILGNNRKKMSKRHDAVNIMKYRDDGFIPETILNYVVKLGWSYKNKELFNINEMKKFFNLSSINNSPSIFDKKKLLWLNHYYINNLPVEYIAKHLNWHIKKKGINIKNGPKLEILIKILGKKYKTLKEIVDNCHYFYYNFEKLNEKLAKKYLKSYIYQPIKLIYLKLKELKLWTYTLINKIIKKITKIFKLKINQICMPLRVAITNSNESPSINHIIYAIGKKTCLYRINIALKFINLN
ncbi:MAG: glutamate--tRNA ligase [gamma proteobacterium endosymbiont of Trioza apicalis]